MRNSGRMDVKSEGIPILYETAMNIPMFKEERLHGASEQEFSKLLMKYEYIKTTKKQTEKTVRILSRFYEIMTMHPV